MKLPYLDLKIISRMIAKNNGIQEDLIIMVWAIRGATTVSDNTADEIVAETQGRKKRT